jgi:uncharacterized protein with PQ loop repeat
MGGVSLFPQLLKVLKTKSTKDISREMLLLLGGSIFLWLVYGMRARAIENQLKKRRGLTN